MKVVGWVAFGIIAFILILYLCNFGSLSASFSDKQDVWGQFGDYFGGVLNPILSFISIVLLIKSVDLQMSANKSIVEENNRQELLEKKKTFESRLFSLIEVQRSYFDDFSILLNNQNGTVKFQKTEAINKIEALVKAGLVRGLDRNQLSSVLQSLDDVSDDKIFSLIRRVYLIIKFIDDEVIESNGFTIKDKKDYFETLVNFTDFATIRLLCICMIYLDWDNLIYITSNLTFNAVLKDNKLIDYMDDLR